MATVTELKEQLAAQERLIKELEPAAAAAKANLDKAQAELEAQQNAPGRIKVTTLKADREAAAADPNNAELQAKYKATKEAWDTQQFQIQPYRDARDAAFKANIEAKAPLIDANTRAADIDIEIAKIDPSQASEEARAYVKETQGLPVSPKSDPAVATEVANKDATTGVVVSPITSHSATPTPIEQLPNPNPNGFEANVENAAPKTVDATQDPLAEAAEAASAANNTGELPTEQVVIDSDPAVAAQVNATSANLNKNPGATGTATGLGGQIKNGRAQETAQDNANANILQDWRVKLQLANKAEYFYNTNNANDAGILAPLRKTDGVIFPYTPQIQVTYSASYVPEEVAHSNYKIFQYKNSSVDNITITGNFTAQDTEEANYLLAVIHFFRSATKMFYGNDKNPIRGTPPPLCYLSGYGEYQFNNHPLVISSFTYSLPDDVDYIRANVRADIPAGTNTSASNNKGDASPQQRLRDLERGGNRPATQFTNTQLNNTGGTQNPTYVPTKIQISITAIPVVSRKNISTDFSLADYARGKFSTNQYRNKGGIW